MSILRRASSERLRRWARRRRADGEARGRVAEERRRDDEARGEARRAANMAVGGASQ